MPAQVAEPEIILLAAGTPEARAFLQRELESSGVRVTIADSADAARDAAASVRRLADARDDLAHMVMHNLKTPLTTLMATFELMADGDFGDVAPRQRTALNDMREKSGEMLALIESLLEIWRLESPVLPLSVSTIDPADLARELAHEWAFRLQHAGARLTIDAADGLPSVHGDSAVLLRVFGNLLQNALVHGARPVELRLLVRADQSYVVFSVVDNGPGIPVEYRELIFERFGRVPGAKASGARGSGLGLAFCRLAVRAHAGEIWVESDGERGSAFHVRLPREGSAAERAP